MVEKKTEMDTQIQVVIGIDFGTSGTAYAIQFREMYLRDHQDIIDDPFFSQHSIKQPTSVLINKKDQNNAFFGNEAETKYSCLTKPENWYFFRNFKMQLYKEGNKGLTNRTRIVGEREDTLPAEDVFSASLRCIRQKVDDLLDKTGNVNIETKKKWVITVPAIWNDSAKQVMRDSASKAGLDGPKNVITIALEPEAAAIYYAVCEAKTDGSSRKCYEHVLDVGPRTVNIVVDIGGGTVDISVLEFEENGMKQIHEPVGCPYGDDIVDTELIKLISNIFEESEWKQFAKESSFAYRNFRSSIEKATKEVKSNNNESEDFRDDFYISLPESMLRNFAKKKDVDLETALADVSLNDKTGCLRLLDGFVVMDSDVLRHIMKASVEEILNYITKVVSDVMLLGRRIHAVILFGGVAMSEFMYDEIDKRMKDFHLTVKRPMFSIFAVLRGAVLYGQNERICYARVVSNTYGILFYRPFAKDDPIDRRKEINGKVYARDCFSKHVTRNQEVGIDQWISSPCTYNAMYEHQMSMGIKIFASKDKNPKYVDEDGCQCIGKFSIDLDPNEKDRIEVSFNFGRTELLVRAINKRTHEEVQNHITFYDASAV